MNISPIIPMLIAQQARENAKGYKYSTKCDSIGFYEGLAILSPLWVPILFLIGFLIYGYFTPPIEIQVSDFSGKVSNTNVVKSRKGRGLDTLVVSFANNGDLRYKYRRSNGMPDIVIGRNYDIKYQGDKLIEWHEKVD